MKKIIYIVVLVLVAVGAFFGGTKYGKSKSLSSFANRQGFPQENGEGMASGGNRLGAGTSLVQGEVIAKDEKSITVKLKDGGSKIVFYADSTEISEFVSGSIDSVIIGESIVANGSSNDDGSITAKSIQIRPEIQEPNISPSPKAD